MKHNNNLFDPEESLFGGDPRNRFQRLRSAVKAFLREQFEADDTAADVVAAARLLRLLLDRKIGDNDGGPAANSPSVLEMMVDTVVVSTVGREMFRA